MSFRAHLAALDVDALAALLSRRPDVLVEPAPRDIAELAGRLSGVDSLSRALMRMDHDEVVAARAVALLGAVPPATHAARLGSDESAVRAAMDRLCARGLAWEHDGRVGLPDRLAEHFAIGLSGFRPLEAIVRQTRVDDLRTAISGLGGDPAGLTKPRLAEALAMLLTDPAVVTRAVAALPAPARRHLDAMVGDAGQPFLRAGAPAALLHAAGLLVGGPYQRPELPREVAVAVLMGERDRVTGRPDLPPSDDPVSDGRAGADAAVLAVTGLLDEAAQQPLARLKKGGIGSRERKRLVARLGLDDPALWIDVAAAAGLLALTPSGYVPSEGYPAWREEPVAARWATVARVWYALRHAPTSRETDDGEVPPPLPIQSAGGMLRRALLRAAAGGHSLRAAAERIDWFCPLHGYDLPGRERKSAAARHEAELLGAVVGDRLSALGELLVEDAEQPTDRSRLAEAAADLLPETRGMVVLQSDLTALVSGRTSAGAARVLGACAVPEARGVAAIWRFTPASVRGALDSGWSHHELHAELAAVSGRELPQPLDYLLTDVARRHGSVRLRGSRTCLTGAEAELTEIMHTRSLASLHLTRLAPTVLTSPVETDQVLAKLRAAGFAPMPEDPDGAVVLPERAPAAAPQRGPRPRARTIDAAQLARQLQQARPVPLPANGTYARLAPLAAHLDHAEIALLADALDRGRDVHIRYRNKDGNRSERTIAPVELWDRWIQAWCHLRSGDREFSVSGIEAVSPA